MLAIGMREREPAAARLLGEREGRWRRRGRGGVVAVGRREREERN